MSLNDYYNDRFVKEIYKTVKAEPLTVWTTTVDEHGTASENGELGYG